MPELVAIRVVIATDPQQLDSAVDERRELDVERPLRLQVSKQDDCIEITAFGSVDDVLELGVWVPTEEDS